MANETAPLDTVLKSDLEILNLAVREDDGTGRYRVRAGRRVHYLEISPGEVDPIYDEDTMCQPSVLIPRLPPFPDSDWTTMQVSRGPAGEVEATVSYDPLDQVQRPWHPRHVDVLSLRPIARYKQRVQEVEFEGRNVIAKIAIFEAYIPSIELETSVYERINEEQNPGNSPIAPKFFAHLTEQGRIIGFLLEKVEGEFASISDLSKCQDALKRLHAMGMLHGDPTRYNFVVETSTGQVKMIDFEHADRYDGEKARLELEELPAELADEDGWGASVTYVDGIKQAVGPVPLP